MTARHKVSCKNAHARLEAVIPFSDSDRHALLKQLLASRTQIEDTNIRIRHCEYLVEPMTKLSYSYAADRRS